MAGLELGVLAAVAHVQNVNAEVAPSRIVDQVALGGDPGLSARSTILSQPFVCFLAVVVIQVRS
ncbi:MAG: hypothetical protein IPO67_21700 [Deltaproteobacteria bacterium]|nr:hypothetical protein [Deltaproteobacteria bacterium]